MTVFQVDKRSVPAPASGRLRRHALTIGVIVLSATVCGTAHAQMRMWKRGAPGGFNAILYLQNSGSEAQQCNVSWANANGGFGDGHTVIVQPGQTQQIQTGIVAVNESYRCNVYVDPFKKRQQEQLEAERRKRESEAQRLQREQEARQRNQQVFGNRPQGSASQGSGSQQNNTASTYTPSSSYTPAYTPPVYTPPPASRSSSSGSNSARNAQMLGAMAQALGAMSESSAASSQAREERERYEAAQRKQREATKARNTELAIQRAMQEAATAPDVNPWGVK